MLYYPLGFGRIIFAEKSRANGFFIAKKLLTFFTKSYIIPYVKAFLKGGMI